MRKVSKPVKRELRICSQIILSVGAIGFLFGCSNRAYTDAANSAVLAIEHAMKAVDARNYPEVKSTVAAAEKAASEMELMGSACRGHASYKAIGIAVAELKQIELSLRLKEDLRANGLPAGDHAAIDREAADVRRQYDAAIAALREGH